jgi:formylglycine-generating enzyme required for sulfatase activity
VTPSRDMTWFQAVAACENSRKRLPSNAEWQAAVIGTPDPGSDNGTTDCNTSTITANVTETGSRRACVSARGAFDMVGNLAELVAEWLPRSTTCASWGFTPDAQCLAGAETTGEPGVLQRGGDYGAVNGGAAGPLTVFGLDGPSHTAVAIGFRCAR